MVAFVLGRMAPPTKRRQVGLGAERGILRARLKANGGGISRSWILRRKVYTKHCCPGVRLRAFFRLSISDPAPFCQPETGVLKVQLLRCPFPLCLCDAEGALCWLGEERQVGVWRGAPALQRCRLDKQNEVHGGGVRLRFFLFLISVSLVSYRNFFTGLETRDEMR